MDVLYPRCCGLDVHKKTVVACCILSTKGRKLVKGTKTFRTMTTDLLALADWLQEKGCTYVAMESTGVSTPPGSLPKRSWSGNRAERGRAPVCACARQRSVPPRLPTPYQ